MPFCATSVYVYVCAVWHWYSTQRSVTAFIPYSVHFFFFLKFNFPFYYSMFILFCGFVVWVFDYEWTCSVHSNPQQRRCDNRILSSANEKKTATKTRSEIHIFNSMVSHSSPSDRFNAACALLFSIFCSDFFFRANIIQLKLLLILYSPWSHFICFIAHTMLCTVHYAQFILHPSPDPRIVISSPTHTGTVHTVDAIAFICGIENDKKTWDIRENSVELVTFLNPIETHRSEWHSI